MFAYAHLVAFVDAAIAASVVREDELHAGQEHDAAAAATSDSQNMSMNATGEEGEKAARTKAACKKCANNEFMRFCYKDLAFEQN